MPIMDTPIMGNNDPFQKIQSVLKKLDTSDVDAQFTNDDSMDKAIDRDYIELVIDEFAQATQNTTIFNKWLQIDTKLEKALREFKADLKLLLSGLTMMNNAQQSAGVQMPLQPQMPAQQQALPSQTMNQRPLPEPQV